MVRGVRARDYENLSKENIKAVIQVLEDGGSKKQACTMLNISYNTKRLDKIIEEYEEGVERTKRLRKKMRSTPITDEDIKYICECYLDGDSLESISEYTFRSSQVIKRVLTNYNIPLRSAENDYFNPTLVPDDAIKEEYNAGDLVYSAKYSQVATIMGVASGAKNVGVYNIRLHGNNYSSAYQPWYELADLTKLKNLGVTPKDLGREEVITLLNEALMKSRKRDKK